MPNVSSANITIKLQHLFSLLQKGEAKTVIKELDALLTRADNNAGNNADVMHLAAMAHKADGSLDKAISYFIESSRINKNQPQVHNNLGNTYKQNLNVVLAEKHYKIAISLNPQYLDALKNLGLLYLSEQKYAQAKLSFQQVLSLSKTSY